MRNQTRPLAPVRSERLLASTWSRTMTELNRGLSSIGNYVVLIAIAAFFVAPLTWLFVSAFRSNPSVAVEFADFTTSNFPRVFTGDTLTWIRNSLFIATAATTMSVVVAFLAAYPFARFNFPGKTVALFVLVMSMTIPLSAIMLPTFRLALFLGLQDTLIGVALILGARQIPLAIWVMKEFIRSVPLELEEAAWVDGAGRLRTLRKVVFPLTGPGLAVIGMMAFITAWGDFTVTLLLISSPGNVPISLGIARKSIEASTSSGLGGEISIDYGLMTAISLIYLAIPIIVFLFAQKYLVKGMVIGAVKG
ncbi:MAG: carbohydrate ABC transporter permease [Dehalococcoidia bacterium]